MDKTKLKGDKAVIGIYRREEGGNEKSQYRQKFDTRCGD